MISQEILWLRLRMTRCNSLTVSDISFESHSNVVSQNYLPKESYSIVIPVKTGIQNNYNILDPRLRGGDALKLLHGISET